MKIYKVYKDGALGHGIALSLRSATETLTMRRESRQLLERRPEFTDLSDRQALLEIYFEDILRLLAPRFSGWFDLVAEGLTFFLKPRLPVSERVAVTVAALLSGAWVALVEAELGSLTARKEADSLLESALQALP